MKSYYLSLIIPCYNEAPRLAQTINKAHAFISRLPRPSQLIIVNDGSVDSSASILKSIKNQYVNLIIINHQKNLGKGAALRTGIIKSTGQYIAFTDADLATPLIHLNTAIKFLEKGHKFIIATRKTPASRILVRQSFFRENLGKVFTKLSNTLLGLNVSDVTCGFKAWDKTTAKLIWSKQTLSDWSFDAEIIAITRLHHIPITEIPITWKNQPQTKVRLMFDIPRSLKGLFQIKYNQLSGRYD